MSQSIKISVAALFSLVSIGYLAFLGGATSWKYYLTVDEAVADGPELVGSRIRVSGKIEAGTLVVGDDRRQATFNLVGESHNLHAVCRCTLPDNLAENIDVVVEGTLEDGCVDGRKVITRCASKYQRSPKAVGLQAFIH